LYYYSPIIFDRQGKVNHYLQEKITKKTTTFSGWQRLSGDHEKKCFQKKKSAVSEVISKLGAGRKQ